MGIDETWFQKAAGKCVPAIAQAMARKLSAATDDQKYR
jgi:hypothetical protein